MGVGGPGVPLFAFRWSWPTPEPSMVRKHSRAILGSRGITSCDGLELVVDGTEIFQGPD
jgi:hypothetical protein